MRKCVLGQLQAIPQIHFYSLKVALVLNYDMFGKSGIPKHNLKYPRAIYVKIAFIAVFKFQPGWPGNKLSLQHYMASNVNAMATFGQVLLGQDISRWAPLTELRLSAQTIFMLQIAGIVNR